MFPKLKWRLVVFIFAILAFSSRADAYTVYVHFVPDFHYAFDGRQWKDLNEQDVKDAIVDVVTDKLSPFGISVSTTSGDIEAKVGDQLSHLTFGLAYTGIGSYLGNAPYITVDSNQYAEHSEFQGSNATLARVSNAIGLTCAHEIGHIFNLYHIYSFESFDPLISGAMDADYYPKEPFDSTIPTSAIADSADAKNHIMASIGQNERFAALADLATVDQTYTDMSSNVLSFAVQGGANVNINMVWGIHDSTTAPGFEQQQDVTVSSGKTLIIAADGYIHDLNGHKIDGNGTIQVEGTVSPDISLQNSGIKGQYSTIQSAINAASSGDTVYPTAGNYYEDLTMKSGVDLIRNGSGVVLVGNADFNTVSNIDVTGIRFSEPVTLYSGGTIDFTDCEFQAPYYSYDYDLTATNTSPLFFNTCDFTSSKDGLYLNNADPFIDECLIHGNSRYGINATNGSEPDVYSANHFYDNSNYDIRADSDCGDIYATDNYWDTSPPNVNHEASPSAEIFWDPVATKPAFASLQEEPAATALRRTGRQFLREKQVDEAIKCFLEVVTSYPNSRSAQISLGHIVAAYQQLGQTQQAFDYLEDLIQHTPNNELNAQARFQTIPVLVALGKPAQAVERANDLIQAYPDSRYERQALFNEGFILALQGNTAGSREAFFKLIETYPTSDEARVSKTLTNALVPSAIAQSDSDRSATEALVLEGNFPNPFNPSTTISFTLEENGPVSLTIYNVLGQQVRHLLISEHLVAGPNRIFWDGKNDLGRQIASGVYLYELRTHRVQRSGRMVLAK